MEIEGIDRVVIGVKDLDKGIEFFSRLLAVDFVEDTGPAAASGGVRIAFNLDQHIELISPVYPLKDVNRPDPKTMAKRIEEQGEAALYALILRAKNAYNTIAETEAKGIRIAATLELENMEPYPFCNYKEVVLNEEDTLDIKIAYASYEPVGVEH